MFNSFENFSHQRQSESHIDSEEEIIDPYDRHYDSKIGMRWVETNSRESLDSFNVMVIISRQSIYQEKIETILLKRGFSRTVEGEKNFVYMGNIRKNKSEDIRAEIANVEIDSKNEDYFSKAA